MRLDFGVRQRNAIVQTIQQVGPQELNLGVEAALAAATTMACGCPICFRNRFR